MLAPSSPRPRLSAAGVWMQMVCSIPIAVAALLAAVFGYSATYFRVESSNNDWQEPALGILYFIYSIIVTVYGAFQFCAGIIWPIAYTHTGIFQQPQPRSRWRMTNLIFSLIMLPTIIIFGACAVAFAAKRIYDDASNGWIEGQAPIYAILVVYAALKLVADWVWIATGDKSGKLEGNASSADLCEK